MPQEESTVDSHQPAFWEKHADFAVKLAILTTAISLGSAYIIDSTMNSIVDTASPIRAKLRAVLNDEKTMVRLKGLLTTNPATHYRISVIEENSGNVTAAIEEIELAIGLLELHNADRAAKEKYAMRLQELKRKLEMPKPSTLGPKPTGQ